MPFTVGIAGGTGSGKTTLARRLVKQFGGRASLISHDLYYRDLSALPESEREKMNFDSPDALETELLVQHLDALKSGECVTLPVYDFATHTREASGGRKMEPTPVLVVEGILLFHDEAVRERLDLRVFVETDADTRILRRIRRDVDERGRSVSSVAAQYQATVKPMHEQYVEPSRAHADLVVNGEGNTERAVALIAAHAEAELKRNA